MVILKESEIPSCLTNGKVTPSQTILEVTHVPFPGCSDQIAGPARINANNCMLHSYIISQPVFMSYVWSHTCDGVMHDRYVVWPHFLRGKKVIWSLSKRLRKFQSVGFLFDVFASLFGSLILRLILKGCYRDFYKDLKDEKRRDAFWVRLSLFWKQSPCKVWWWDN